MKSTGTFKQYFYLVHSENITSAALGGSEGGFSSNNISSSDFYAPEDARIATPSKVIQTRKGVIKRKKVRRRRKK
jgi:hypothetical protein